MNFTQKLRGITRQQKAIEDRVQSSESIKAFCLIAVTLMLAACGKQSEPSFSPATPTAASTSECDKLLDPKPRDESAASKAAAVSEGIAVRAACNKTAAAQLDKPNADLARIREIKEKEQADLAAKKVSNEEYSRQIKEGSAAPLRDYKY